MKAEIKETLLAALAQYHGDDYERAKAAFRGLTPDEMQDTRLGMVPQEILDFYKAHVDAVNDAVAFVKGL